MHKSLLSIQIDEDRNHVLTSFTKTKSVQTIQESDHNSLITKFNLKWEDNVKHIKTEVFNFNNKDGQKRFKEMPSNHTKLSDIFDSNKNINKQTKKFIKKLDGILHQCLKKFKITGAHNKEVDDLFKQQKQLKTKEDMENKRKLKDFEENLAD